MASPKKLPPNTPSKDSRDHLRRLLDNAEKAAEGEVVDLTDMSRDELLTFLRKSPTDAEST